MIEVDINEKDATFVVTPDHGRRVVFDVRYRMVPIRRCESGVFGGTLRLRWVVGLKGSDGDGLAAHTDFEKACRSALWRARRYERAYSVPRVAEQKIRGAA